MHFLIVCSYISWYTTFSPLCSSWYVLRFKVFVLILRPSGQQDNYVARTCQPCCLEDNRLPDGKECVFVCEGPASNSGKLSVTPDSLAFPLCSPCQMRQLCNFKRAMLFICIKGRRGAKRDQERKQQWTNFCSIWTTLSAGSEIARLLSKTKNGLGPRCLIEIDVVENCKICLIYEELCNFTPFSKRGFMKCGETKGIILVTTSQCCKTCLTSADFMATAMGTLSDYFATHKHNAIHSAVSQWSEDTVYKINQ